MKSLTPLAPQMDQRLRFRYPVSYISSLFSFACLRTLLAAMLLVVLTQLFDFVAVLTSVSLLIVISLSSLRR
jgi:hypothetical protein